MSSKVLHCRTKQATNQGRSVVYEEDRLPGRFPSDVILMRATSAGVPTKAPVAPAVIPRPALVRKLGGLPSGLENFSNRYV